MTPGERNAYALALEESNARDLLEKQLQGQIKATAAAEVLLAEARAKIEGLEVDNRNLKTAWESLGSCPFTRICHCPSQTFTINTGDIPALPTAETDWEGFKAGVLRGKTVEHTYELGKWEVVNSDPNSIIPFLEGMPKRRCNYRLKPNYKTKSGN